MSEATSSSNDASFDVSINLLQELGEAYVREREARAQILHLSTLLEASQRENAYLRSVLAYAARRLMMKKRK